MQRVPPEAVAALQTFMDASLRKDLPAMKSCLTRESLAAGQLDGSGPEGVRMVLGEGRLEEGRAVIPVTSFAIDAPPDSPPALQMDCLLVQEDGQWKFDFIGTTERMFGGAMEAAVTQIGDAMGSAMEGTGDAFSAGMGGFDEPGEDDPAWDAASLKVGADELSRLPALTPLPQSTARVSAALGVNVPVEAALADLLAQLGSNQADQLIDWLDGTLFGEWAQTFAPAAALGLGKTLRSVRIETAERAENRTIVLDGSDLVYRMNLIRNDGYFGDDFIAPVVTGVLAGLPEAIDPDAAGQRLLPLDVDDSTVEAYRQKWVPRWMRRIRTLMGKPIRFEIDWRAAADANNVARQLPIWGLNRIFGGLALARLDASRKTELVRDLRAVELAVGSSSYSRAAKYENGKLTVGLCYYGGDTPGCYEHEIAAALAGQPL